LEALVSIQIQVPGGAIVTRMADRESARLEQLRTEAAYHQQRLDLYKAKLYGGRAVNMARLEEFQRASDNAAARLRDGLADPRSG
jgi:hypothetical protein